MSDYELKALCVFLVCADNEKLAKEHATLREFANKESLIHGFSDWIDACHRL